MATYQYRTEELKKKLNKIVEETENTIKILSEEHGELLPIVIEQRNELREKIKSVVDQVDEVVNTLGDEYTDEWIEWNKRTITKLFVKEPTKYKRDTNLSVDKWYSHEKFEELCESLLELEKVNDSDDCWIYATRGWFPDLGEVAERYIDGIKSGYRCHIYFLPPMTKEFGRILELDSKISETTSSLTIVKRILTGMNGSDTTQLSQHEAECIEELSKYLEQYSKKE